MPDEAFSPPRQVRRTPTEGKIKRPCWSTKGPSVFFRGRLEDIPAVLAQRANFAPANSAMALSVVCAAFSPSRKSLSLNVE